MSIAKDSSIRRITTLADILDREGDPYSSHYTAENANLGTPPTGTLSNLAFPSFGRAWWVENVHISSNRNVVVNISFGFTQTNVNRLVRCYIPANAAPTVIPVRALFRPQHAAAGSLNLAPISIRASHSTDVLTSGSYLWVVGNGTLVYDDLNLGADKIGLVIGDSICNDTTGVTTKVDSMEWKVREYFKANGNNVRFINKSLSGSTSSDHERIRAQGSYDFPQVDYIHYQLGTNDVTASISATTHGNNVAAAIAWKQRVYPNAKMVVWGSTPLANNTNETALALLRTAASNAVTAAADPNVKFCSLATAFDRTVSSNYTEAAGSGVHPTTAAHLASYNVMAAFLTAQGFDEL